ncbi:MAG: hypothetical protein JNK02_00510 [Planctomycetes bacterium]|nr:hypothetical protein [Planctomycetota bacterium]
MTLLTAALLAATPLAGQDAYPTTGAGANPGHQPGAAVTTPQRTQSLPKVRLERLNAGIPWPRGIAQVDDKLVVVTRGRHRNYGGPARSYEDFAGHLYLVDPDVFEPYEAGKVPGQAILENQVVLATPDESVVHVYDRSKEPVEDALMNRPYCTLVYDPPSRNVIFCAFSGVDLGTAPFFRKNATDALYRYDLRSRRWGIVELHRDDVVPAEARTEVISNEYYPHHDPRKNPPPHGFLNGPNSCTVAGQWLYAVGKDNHTLARYDLTEIRKDPQAGAPRAEFVLGDRARVRVKGVEQEVELLGHSALAANDEWLYLGTRTNSVVVRFPIDAQGNLVKPVVGELIAEFEPWTSESKRSADIWDMTLDSAGNLYVSCARAGRVWKIEPDPAHPFDGDDHRKDPPTPNKPYLDGPLLTGAKNARISNLTFDSEGRLVFCATFTESHTDRAGGVFRVIEQH